MSINDKLLRFLSNNLVKNFGTEKEPLFKANEIGDLLGIKNIRDTIRNLDESCKIKIHTKTNETGVGPEYSSDTWFLTLKGVLLVI